LNSAKVRFLRIDYERVLDYLKEYASKIVERGDAELVILFGSLARGDYTGTSDADLLIISNKAKERFIDRAIKFMDPRAPIPIEPIVLTFNEAVEAARRGSLFMREALRVGIILAGDRSLHKELAQNLESKEDVMEHSD